MQNLRLIELELFAHCNRRCKWCPNCYIDRQNNLESLNLSILIKLIKELKEINYSGYITFSRYNEPMSDIDTLKAVCAAIKKELSNCTLVSNTNGDFFNRENLTNLAIDELTIMDYDGLGINKCKERLKQAGCKITNIEDNFIYATFNNMKILYYVNWQENYIPGNRGGSLPIQTPIRTYPCTEPLYFIGINYDGTVSPCCNIRSDVFPHRSYLIGNLYNQSLQEILNSQKRKEFIEYCEKASFEVDSPCFKCTNTGGRYTRENGGIKYE